MFIPPPLLADLDDIIKVVFFLIVGAFWLIKQLMGNDAAKPQKPAPPRIPPPVQPGAAPPMGGQGPLKDEVADFLRRATQRKGHPQEIRAEAFQYQVPQGKKKRGEKSQKAKRSRDLQERHEVDEHVRERLDTSKFGQRAQDLGDLDDRPDRFSHDLGRLAQSDKVETAPPPPVDPSGGATAAATLNVAPAAAIAELLRRPESVRQAVILQEILKRPGQR